jgi:FkbM family methyltransferase
MNTSYSQNFEDIILWRSLGHIPNGFYVDVGAHDPEIHSVTKLFYDHGWSGINIEPTLESWERLATARLRDTNLRCLAGSAEGFHNLYIIPNTGLSTVVHDIAELHEQNGFQHSMTQIPVQTLNTIIQSRNVEHIHFLKIDVEGHEKEVLLGLDLTTIRPWIIVIESITPSTREYIADKWDYLILSHEYKLVYRDGINNFYLAKEHSALGGYFSHAVNILDKFQLRATHDLIPEEVKDFHAELIKSQEREHYYKLYIDDIERSVYWRITGPVRTIVKSVRNIYSYLQIFRDGLISNHLLLRFHRKKNIQKNMFRIAMRVAPIVQTIQWLLVFARSKPAYIKVLNNALKGSPVLRSRLVVLWRAVNTYSQQVIAHNNNVHNNTGSTPAFTYAFGLYEALADRDRTERVRSDYSKPS